MKENEHTNPNGDCRSSRNRKKTETDSPYSDGGNALHPQQEYRAVRTAPWKPQPPNTSPPPKSKIPFDQSRNGRRKGHPRCGEGRAGRTRHGASGGGRSSGKNRRQRRCSILGFVGARARMVRWEEIGPKVAGVGSRWERRQGGAAMEEIAGDGQSWVSSGQNLLVETRAGRNMSRGNGWVWCRCGGFASGSMSIVVRLIPTLAVGP
jgi:hypothetical protein